MRKRNYSKLMGIAAATLSAAVIASPMTARAEGTNENTGVASESGSGASSSESTSSESGSSASSSEGTSSESGSGASSSEGTSSESNASGAASSSTEGTTASATESGASTSASSTEGATTTESTSTTSTGTTSTETTGTAATGATSTESTGTTTTESTGATSTESTGTSTATTVAPNGTATSAPIAAEGNTSANMESTGTTVKAESTSSTTTNSDGSVTETVTTTTTTTEVKDPVFTTTDVQPGTADYDHIQTDADGNPVKDPNGDVIHPITKTEATQGTTTTVSTTTTSTTTKTETTTTTTMTNAEIWNNKNVHTLDKDGNLIDANATLDKDTKDYLNSQNVTADFDVYANTMDKTCGHIDGNIAVNKLNASTVLMNKEGQYGKTTSISSDKKVDKQYAQNGYSYVGNVADGVYIDTCSNQYDDAGHNVSLLVTGSDVTNTNAKGDANHFKSVTLTPGATVDGKVTEAAHQDTLKQEARLKNLREVSDIKNNLADIAEKGQKVIEDTAAQTGTSTLTNLQKLQKIGALLEQNQLTNQDIITVTIGAAVLSNRNNAGQGDSNAIEVALAKLVSANTQGAHIVLNVVIGDQDVEVSTTGTRIFSVDRHLQQNITDYDARAAYLNWNFGNFTGKINITSTFAGNVIAPSAYLHAGNGLQSGRVVSDTASSGGELHHAIKGQIHEVTVKNVTVVSEESELKSESKNTTTNSWVSYTYPTYPETPETPEMPKTPETPETPKTPETPETPKTPETPETPEAPSHHESHDDDDHDDPSWDIQYFTEDPHVLGVSREREIPISYMPFIEEGHVLGESRPKNPVENVLGVSRSVQTGDAGNMNAYAIASILSILTLAGWAVSYKER